MPHAENTPIGPTSTNLATLTVAGVFVRLLTDYCAAQGLDATQLLAQRGLTESATQDPDARVTCTDFLHLCAYAAEQLHEPNLGLNMNPSYLGPYGFALVSASNVREMIEQAARYSTLAIGGGHNVFDERDGECIRYWRSDLPDGYPGDLLLGDLVTASSVAMGRLISGMPHASPKWVSFRHAVQQERRDYEDFYRCPLTFDAEDYAVGIDDRFLDMPLTQGHPQVLAAMTALCDRLLESLARPKDPPWLIECRRLVLAALKTGSPDLSSIADQLYVAPVTLRAHLAKHSITFRQLVDDHAP